MRLRAQRSTLNRSANGESLSLIIPYPALIQRTTSIDLPLIEIENKYKRRRNCPRRLLRTLRKFFLFLHSSCETIKSDCYDRRRFKLETILSLSTLLLTTITLLKGSKSTWVAPEDRSGTALTSSFPIQVRLEGLTLSQIGHKNSVLSPDRDIGLLIPAMASRHSIFHLPHKLGHKALRKASSPDYGSLDIVFLEGNVSKVIVPNPWEFRGKVYDSRSNNKDDDIDIYYYAFDDDYLRDNYQTFDDDDIKSYGSCRRVSWHRLQFPNCNTFHEMDSSHFIPRYLSYGYYRDVFVHTSSYLGHIEEVILKSILFGFTTDMYEFTRMDAFISERLTSSERIVDIYGHCGLSILSELVDGGYLEDIIVPGEGYMKPKNLDDHDDVKPQNNLTANDKLLIALEMAESIALLHNYPGGRIVHDDIQLSQFLRTKNGYIKLNDFNRAEIMLWDEENQKYCKYRNDPGHGNYRAPEEYLDKPLDEKIDIFSFGNNIYALLTGLWPFYEDGGENDDLVQHRVIDGVKPYVDPRYRNRSIAEGVLVQMMEACWAYDPADRPTINQIVGTLQKTVDSLNVPHG